MIQRVQRLVAQIAIAWNIVCTLLWLLLLTRGGGWHYKINLLYRIDASLYGVDLGHGGVGLAVLHLVPSIEETFKGLLSKEKHYYTMFEFKDMMCGPLLNSFPGYHLCDAWQQILWSSVFLIFMVLVGNIIMLVGTGMFYNYWWVHARKESRRCTFWLLSIGYAWIALGEAQYWFMTSSMSEMPPRDVHTFEWCSYCSVFLTVLQLIPLPLAATMGANIQETKNEAVSDLKHWKREEQLMETEHAMMMQAGMAPPGQMGGGSWQDGAAGWQGGPQAGGGQWQGQQQAGSWGQNQGVEMARWG